MDKIFNDSDVSYRLPNSYLLRLELLQRPPDGAMPPEQHHGDQDQNEHNGQIHDNQESHGGNGPRVDVRVAAVLLVLAVGEAAVLMAVAPKAAGDAMGNLGNIKRVGIFGIQLI